jgi:hypothetical protein
MMNSAFTSGRELVDAYLRSKYQSVLCKFGRAEVNICQGRWRKGGYDLPEVRVNWCAMGEQTAAVALGFSANLVAAAACAAEAQAIIDGWGGADQWTGPDNDCIPEGVGSEY